MTNAAGNTVRDESERTLASWELEALAKLRPGKDGRAQPRTVRALLRRAERAGLVTFRDGAWRLSPAGELACLLAASVVVELATPAGPLFRIEDGEGSCTATADELREANGGDRAILEWLDVAAVGETFGGYHSLRVERIR